VATTTSARSAVFVQIKTPQELATDQVPFVSVVKLTAAGSAVQETFFPGTDMEMVSMYHLDKGVLSN